MASLRDQKNDLVKNGIGEEKMSESAEAQPKQIESPGSCSNAAAASGSPNSLENADVSKFYRLKSVPYYQYLTDFKTTHCSADLTSK